MLKIGGRAVILTSSDLKDFLLNEVKQLKDSMDTLASVTVDKDAKQQESNLDTLASVTVDKDAKQQESNLDTLASVAVDCKHITNDLTIDSQKNQLISQNAERTNSVAINDCDSGTMESQGQCITIKPNCRQLNDENLSSINCASDDTNLVSGSPCDTNLVSGSPCDTNLVPKSTGDDTNIVPKSTGDTNIVSESTNDDSNIVSEFTNDDTNIVPESTGDVKRGVEINERRTTSNFQKDSTVSSDNEIDQVLWHVQKVHYLKLGETHSYVCLFHKQSERY